MKGLKTIDFALMYHYVRDRSGWNGIHPLRPEEFAQQIDVISRTHRIVSVDEIRKPSSKPKALITFDDGTKDQYEHAFNILRKKGVPAYFSVLSGPRMTGIIPLVHLVHTVLSFTPDEELWAILSASCDTSNVPEESRIYHYETNPLRRYNKYVINFMLEESEARKILEPVFKSIFPDTAKFIEDFYISDSELIEMDRAGMTIGVHGHHHIPYYDDAEHYYQNEILPCKNFLEKALGIVPRWYTPPWGGGKLFEKMRQDLTPILLEQGFVGGFSTIPRIIEDVNAFWFSRIDCNRLPVDSSLKIESVLHNYC
jgi:peptidoglycan/xylan/chitin deacetylase (PgdA/CDA1 family)